MSQFKTPPFKHQLEAFERFREADYFALFWEMGTGKTKLAIDIANHKFNTGAAKRFIVIAPNTVQSQWINEQLAAHSYNSFKGFVFESKSTDKYNNSFLRFVISAEENMTKMHWLAIHFEAFQHDAVKRQVQRFIGKETPFWIVDEATNIKNPDAKQTRAICQLRRTFGGPACVLTGTSLAKSPVDVWSMIEFLKQGYMVSSFTAFKKRHAIMTKHEVEINRGGRTIRTKIDIALSPAKFWKVKHMLIVGKHKMVNPLDEEEREVLFSDVARANDLYRKDIDYINEAETPIKYKNIDALKIQLSEISSSLRKVDAVDLPAKQYKEIVLPLSSEQKSLIHRLKEYGIAQYGDKELTLTQKVALQIRALQICGGFFPHFILNKTATMPYAIEPLRGPNAKLDYLIREIPELGESPFIVWAVFVAELNMLHSQLKKQCTAALLSGDTPKKEREEIRQAFVGGDIQCLVANPQIAGYGLNFQHALTQYFYSRNYRTELRLQAEDRSHRIGIAGSPLYVDLVYDAEFEKAVMQSNKDGKEMNDYFNSKTIETLFSL